MDWIAGGAGALIVLVVGTDIALTVLHPTVRGPLTMRITRLTWFVLRRVSARLVGPSALALTFVAWIGGLWLGFALIFLPFEESIRGVPGAWGFGDALYLSGESLTTVGFGDVAPATEALRLVAVLEAAGGLAAITAAITYLLSLFAVLSDLRVAAARAADLRATEVRPAAALALHGGPGEARALQRDVIAVEEHLRRFPVLFFFDPKAHNYALSLLEAAAVSCVVLRWGVRPERLPYAAEYGRALQRTLERVSDTIRDEFVGAARRATPLEEEDAGARLHAVRSALRELDPALPQEAAPDDELRDFLGRVDEFLSELAATHALEHRPLLTSARREHGFGPAPLAGNAPER